MSWRTSGAEAERNPLAPAFRGASPLGATDRELAEIEDAAGRGGDRRLAHLQDINFSEQYPGILGHLPGTERLAEQGVGAGDITRTIERAASPTGSDSNRSTPRCPGSTTAELGRNLLDPKNLITPSVAPRLRAPASTSAELGRNLIDPKNLIKRPMLPDLGVAGRAHAPAAGRTSAPR